MKVRSMKGEEVDMTRLMAENENVIALGNASMNARGDRIGARGQILQRREVVTQQYYAQNPKAVRQVSLRNIAVDAPTTFATPEEAVAAAMKAASTPKAPTQAVREAPRKARKIEDKED
jgi:hypothetical protein